MECKESDESFQERQSNEFTILQSMFPGDIKDLRPITSQVYHPTDFIITLAPQESTDPMRNAYVKVDLRVTCLHTYPDTIPAICLENARGISNQATAQLKEELLALAKNLCGEVMILDLIQHVKTFLCQHNTPQYASFYEEMMSNQKRVEEEQLKDMQTKDALRKITEAQQRKAIQDEMARKQSALREESHWKKMRSSSSDQSLDEIPVGSLINVSNTQSQVPPKSRMAASTPIENVCEHKGSCVLQFSHRHPHKIQRGKCLGHKYNDSLILYSGMDLTTGDYVTISEWMFKCPISVRKPKSKSLQTSDSGTLKQLATLEQELSYLCKLKHSNLLAFFDMKTYQEKEGMVCCLVLQEFVLGHTLAYYLDQNLPVEYQRLQHYMLGILQALSFLHKKSIIHRDLKDTNVFIDNRGIVRVAGYSLDKRLLDLYCSTSKENIESRFPSSIGRGGKKGDIFRLGLLGLSLAQGEVVTSTDPDIPKTFPNLFQDFLEKCLAQLEEDRLSADELLNHLFVKPSLIHQDRDYISPDHCTDKEEDKEINIIKDQHLTESKFHQLIPKEAHNYQSRLHEEFEIIGFIGKGGFGSVFKARNKLDRGIYAIKCIQLNPNNKQLNRKITREVKLLSRLNHENVIRYYNSWLETACLQDATNCDANCEDVSLEEASQDEKRPTTSLKVGNSIIWNGSYNYKKSDEFDCSSSEEDEDIFGTSFLHCSEVSESIIFENSTNNTTTEQHKSKNIDQTVTKRFDAKASFANSDGSSLVQLMYIQMEFCDKNTLLDAIANDLYRDEERVWRLFREIVEGLAHIHQQGMIHRDLKPGNIFIDAQNHVKIGDFGLATNIVCDTHIVHQIETPEMIDQTLQSDGMDAGNQTGMVGTTLYIAPEVQMQAPNAVYNQKIDIYSLGIIFFEMCSPPLNTSMERCKVLSNLRRPEIIFPPEFNEKDKSQQIDIIKWLLNHESRTRPTSQELLQSKYLPPPQMEEAELQEMLRHTISNPQCKAYKHMISSLLKQESTTAANVTYDIDISKGSYSNKVALTQKFVNETLVKVFKKHGAIPVNISFLMPKLNLYEKDELCVNLVDHSGGVVSLPYDLRVPFARFVVKNNVTFLKRYHISPVYRERKVYGCHPRTLYECAFDVVTPDPGRLIADAEVILVINEIFYEFPILQNHRSFIQLNHTSILKGILMACGIHEDKHGDVYCILQDAKVANLNQNQLIMRLGALNLSEHMASTLCKLLTKEGTPQQISNHLKCTLRRGEARNIIMQGISELETVIFNAKSMGLTTTIVVTLNLILRNMQHFSGSIFQYVCELKKKQKKERLDILASGGRYDQLIAKTRSMMDISGNKDVTQSGVGVSIAVEKLVAALLDCDEFQPTGSFDVLICALGSNIMMKERSKIARELWNGGVSVHMLDDTLQSLEEIQELCKSFFATHIIILKDTDVGICRVRWWDKDRYTERKVSSTEIVEYMLKKLAVCKSKTDVSESGNESSMTANIKRCSITFVTNEKFTSISRRRYEGQIISNLNHILECFSSRMQVCILAVELKSQILKELAAHIKMDGRESDFRQSVSKVIEHHQRHRKYIERVSDEIFKIKSEQKQPVLITYGLHDSSYTVIM